jgi:hypothetical protein
LPHYFPLPALLPGETPADPPGPVPPVAPVPPVLGLLDMPAPPAVLFIPLLSEDGRCPSHPITLTLPTTNATAANAFTQ